MLEGKNISAYILTSFDIVTGTPIGAYTMVCEGKVVKHSCLRSVESSVTDYQLQLINEILRWLVVNSVDCNVDIYIQGRFATQVYTEMFATGKYSGTLFEDEKERLEESRGLMTDKIHFVPIAFEDNTKGFVEYTRQLLQATMEVEEMAKVEEATREECEEDEDKE